MLPTPIPKGLEQKNNIQKQASQQNIQTNQRQNTISGGPSNNNTPADPSVVSSPTLPQVLKHVDNYIVFNEKLGGGQFSQVYKAMDKNDKTHQKHFAVKIIPMSTTQYQKFANYNQLLQKEIEILLKARHSNLICMHDLKQTPNNLYLFLDYCNGGDLRQYIVKKKNRLAEEEAVEFFKQMCSGYQALNEKMIIHRDLKPENILLHDNKIKIGDFGFARIVNDLDQAVRMTQKCSPLYAPPQILLNEKYSSKCDVWSMGCIFFEMLYGKPPFTAHSIISLTENIKKVVGSGPYNLPSYPPIAQEAKDILVRMLMYHEKDRISWDEIFNHPILQKHLQKKVVENVQIEPSNNPLYKSIRKNIDAVWETSFKPVSAHPPNQTNTAVPSSNQTVFNKEQQNAATDDQTSKQQQFKDNQFQQNQQEKMVSTTSSNNVNNGQVVNTTINTPNNQTKTYQTPSTGDEKSGQQQNTHFQRHDRRYSQYAQTVVPSQPPQLNNNINNGPSNTERGGHSNITTNQNKENILKRANSISTLDNNFGFQTNKNTSGISNNNSSNQNISEVQSNQSPIPQTDRSRKESSRSHTINYTTYTNQMNGTQKVDSIPGNDQHQTQAVTPKNPYIQNNNYNNNLSFKINNQTNHNTPEQQSSFSYRDRADIPTNTLTEKYATNKTIQQQKENIYRGIEKEKAQSFHQTAPFSNQQNVITPTNGNTYNQVNKTNNQTIQTNQNVHIPSKNNIQTAPTTPSTNKQNYFFAPTNGNNGSMYQQTQNTFNNTKYFNETQNLSNISNKDKEIISKIEENKDLSENEKYVLYMKQIKIKEAERAFVSKIDNFFSFMRKRALFANATLLNFWNSTRQFKLPSDLQCSILYCLCCYYYYGLEYLRKILLKEAEQKVIKKDGFDVYQKSQEYQQTKDLIQKDVQEAKQLFTDIEPFMMSEIQLSNSQEAQDFIKFIQNKPSKHDDFRVKLQQIFTKSLKYIDMNNIDRTASKGIHMTQIFTFIEEFIPSKQYNEFDFNKFYDDRFNNTSLEEFKVAINTFNSKYYSISNIK